MIKDLIIEIEELQIDSIFGFQDTFEIKKMYLKTLRFITIVTEELIFEEHSILRIHVKIYTSERNF